MRSVPRNVCIVFAFVGWGVWMTCLWVTRHNPDSEPWLFVVRDVGQMIAGALTIAGVLTLAMTPALKLALAWKDIGAEEQRNRHCSVCPMNPASNIVPLRFNGRLARDAVRLRDN